MVIKESNMLLFLDKVPCVTMLILWRERKMDRYIERERQRERDRERERGENFIEIMDYIL